jgi:CelD/BcsL family acetyltransferase involved in cellulose biosynthesis
MHYEIISNPAELEALAPEWSRLGEICPWVTPFQLPEWQLPWLRHLGGGQSRTVVIKDGNELAGVLPLSVFSSGAPPLRTAVINGTGISDYLDFIALPDKADAAGALLLRALRDMQSDWDICDFQEIKSESPLMRLNVSGDMCMETAPMQACPVLELPATKELLDPLMKRRQLRSLRRAHRLLNKAGEARLETSYDGNYSDFLESLFHLHGKRWREKSQAGVLDREALRSFHREAAALMHRRGMLRMHRLVLNGETLSVLYLFTAGEGVFCYLSGFEPAAEHFSPGAVAVRYAIEQAVDEGKKRFDFLRGNEKYKYLWGAKDRINYRITIKKSF